MNTVTLTTAESRWMMDAICALYDFGVTEVDDAARETLARGNCEKLDAATIMEMEREEVSTALLLSLRCLLAEDAGDADAAARDYGRPRPE